MNLLRYVVKCTVTDSLLNTQTSCSKCPPSAWIHFLTGVTRGLVTQRSTGALLMLLAALRIRWSSSLVFTLCGPRRWRNVTNHTFWGLELIQRHNSNRLHISAGSRCWLRRIWYGYIPSVCNVRQTLRVEVSDSRLNSRTNSESEMLYCVRTHRSDLQRLLISEQLKCNGSFYSRWSQQYQKLPFMGSW